MNLETLQEKWKTDCQIDTDQYGNASIIIPQLHQRWMEFYNTFSLMKKEREGEMRRLIKEKWIYYKGKAPATVYREVPFDLKLTSREEVETFINGDSEVITLRSKLSYIEMCTNYLDSIIRMINNRGFHIKNAIDWEKFQAGM